MFLSSIQLIISVSSFELYLFMGLILILIGIFWHRVDFKCLNTQDIWTKTAEKKFKLCPSHWKQSSLKEASREEIESPLEIK